MIPHVFAEIRAGQSKNCFRFWAASFLRGIGKMTANLGSLCYCQRISLLLSLRCGRLPHQTRPEPHCFKKSITSRQWRSPCSARAVCPMSPPPSMPLSQFSLSEPSSWSRRRPDASSKRIQHLSNVLRLPRHGDGVRGVICARSRLRIDQAFACLGPFTFAAFRFAQ